MFEVSLKEAKAGLSAYVDEAMRGEFVTIMRHGKPAAVLVPLVAADIARKAMRLNSASLSDHLLGFPGGKLERNRSASRDVDL